MKRVKFKLLSNLMVGGVRTTDNFLISESFVRGSVLRAAFAWDVLRECPFAEEKVDGKRYIVAYRGEKCGSCPKSEICKQFGGMSFSYLYPEGSIPAPFTLRECKNDGTKHPIKDTIAENGRLTCDECKERMETVKGFINPDTMKSVPVSMSTSTHTAIDPVTRTMNTGLFSINAISSGQSFEGCIDDLGTGLLSVGKVIYVGKYSSCGFGKLVITAIDDAAPTECSKNIDAFNERFGETLRATFGDSKRFASLLFLSDAKLGLEDFVSGPISSECYRVEWQRRIFGDDSPIRLERIYAQNFIYAGYDTSRDDKQWQKEPFILTEKGTSVLLSFDSDKESEAIAYLNNLAAKGIGEETEIGYGRIEVCGKLHGIGVGEHE